MRRLNKINSKSPFSAELCISSLKVAHTTLGSFHKHLEPDSVPGIADTEINDTHSVHKHSQCVETMDLQTDGYRGGRGAEESNKDFIAPGQG